MTMDEREVKAPGRLRQVGPDHQSRRIDNYLFGELKDIPKSRIYQMLRRGEVRVNGGRIKPFYKLQSGDQVRIPPTRQAIADEPAPAGDFLKRKVADSFIYEDDDLVVLNKPAGIVVHGGTGRSWGVIELLRALRADANAWQLVHRLDRETSGCLLIAKSMPVLRRLNAALVAGDLEKEYLSLLKGRLPERRREVKAPLASHRTGEGERMVAVDETGKTAQTQFETLREFPQTTLVRVRLLTGRTHQIRVHAAHLGHPIAGDDKYGDRDFNRQMRQFGLRRIFLHACQIELPADMGLHCRRFAAPMPEGLQSVIDRLEFC
jgi:23S rRNA pseudouridine955/2504/2580 synthase